MPAAIFWYHGYRTPQADYWLPFFLWLHVLSGITWIGLLYYFNLVQTPVMPTIPPELKPGVGKYILPGGAVLVPLVRARDRRRRPDRRAAGTATCTTR